MTLTRFCAVAVMLGVPFCAGCGGEQLADVTGTIKMDGKPLPEGEIIFEAADGTKAPVAAPIRDGAYAAQVPPGAKKVKVLATRPPKRRDPILGDTAREPMVGPEYNDRTTLTADIKPGKNADVNFEVKELPK